MTKLATESTVYELPEAILDRRGRALHDLRISVIDQCNFRCTYCMPENDFPGHHDFLDRKEYLSFEEIERLASGFVQLGVKKIRITGGEPLLRKNLHELIARLARIPELDDIALTTNGVLLKRHAKSLADSGLKRVTVSLDSIDEKIFAQMNGGRKGLDGVLAGIGAAAEAGLGPIKINSVIHRGKNDDAVLDLLKYFRHSGHIVRFIEYMDVGTRNNWRSEDVVPSKELIAMISERWPLAALDSNFPGEVATRYRFVDGAGEVGFISSVTAPFCGDCSRARVSTDGRLYTCLFATNGVDLKPILRTKNGAGLRDKLESAWSGRDDRYSETRATRTPKGVHEIPLEKVEMYRMGG